MIDQETFNEASPQSKFPRRKSEKDSGHMKRVKEGQTGLQSVLRIK